MRRADLPPVAASDSEGDAGYRWVVLAVGTVAQASVSIVLLSVAVLAPQIRATLGLSLAQTGVVLAAVGIGMTPALLPWGLLTDRVGERVVLPIGLGLAALVLVPVGYAGSFVAVVLLLALAGALTGSSNAASGRAVMQWFPRAERGLALGIRQSSVPLGGLVAAVALPALAAAEGLGPTYVAVAATCGLSAALGAALLRNPPDDPPTLRTALPRTQPLRRPDLWLLSCGSALLIFAQTATMAFTVLFLNEGRGMSIHAAALVFALSQLVGAVLRIVVGAWSDRGGNRIVPLRRLMLAISVSMVVVASASSASLWLLVPVLVVAGGVAMSWNGLSFASAAEIAGVEGTGTALGLQQTLLGVAGIVAPIVFASIVSARSWGVGFFAVAAFPLAAWALVRPLAGAHRGGRVSRGRAAR